MAEGGILTDPGTINENLEEQDMELEVLQSIFEADHDRLEILSKFSAACDGVEEAEAADTSNMLKLYAPVQADGGLLHVDVCQPVAMETNNANSSDPRLTLARSESGHRVIWSFETKFLPPVCLHVTLPPTYPSHDAPSFVMSCDWLSPNQMTALCHQLDQLWLDNKPDDSPGMQILYIWVNWLQENILSFLGLEKQLTVSTHTLDEDVDDCRIITESDHVEEIVSGMLRYSREMERKEFSLSQHECSICFDELPGQEFILLSECNHHVCTQCMQGHCQHIVAEGSVQNLLCPLYDCKSTIPPYVLQEVLTEVEYAHYEDVALQKSLNMMTDVTWCPRCHNVVIQEPEEDLNLGRCPYCFFNFCTECQEKWHQGEPCRNVGEDDAEVKASKVEVETMERIEAAARRNRMQNLQSVQYIKRMTKRCPACCARVMKTFGCNKVVCGSCQRSMCWQCMNVIDSYIHFQENPSCKTFSSRDEDMVDNTDIRVAQPPSVRRIVPKLPTKGMQLERRLKEEPELLSKVLRCKMCKCKNLKEDRCNLIRCWNCKSALCFQCQERILGPVGKHFMAGSMCAQHS